MTTEEIRRLAEQFAQHLISAGAPMPNTLADEHEEITDDWLAQHNLRPARFDDIQLDDIVRTRDGQDYVIREEYKLPSGSRRFVYVSRRGRRMVFAPGDQRGNVLIYDPNRMPGNADIVGLVRKKNESNPPPANNDNSTESESNVPPNSLLEVLKQKVPEGAKKPSAQQPVAPPAPATPPKSRNELLKDLISRRVRVLIAGPAGSGKTTAAQKACEELGRPMFVLPPCGDAFQVFGFTDAVGNYQPTEVYRWATTPDAVLLIDEVDGSFAPALLALNTALANDFVIFPTGKVQIPPGNTVVCTANTWGLGGTHEYVGRTKLDAAFLNRFPAKLEWGYDEKFEAKIVEHSESTSFWHACRRNALAQGVKVVISPRDMLAYKAMRECGFSHVQAVASSVLATLPEDSLTRVLPVTLKAAEVAKVKRQLWSGE